VAERTRGTADGLHRPCHAGIRPGRLTIDWVPDAELEQVDPAGSPAEGRRAGPLTFTRHLRVVRCGDGRAVREITGITSTGRGSRRVRGRGSADHPLDGRFSTSLTLGRVAARPGGPPWQVTTDFRTFERPGSSSAPKQGRSSIPERIGGIYAALHRPCAEPRSRGQRCGSARRRTPPLGSSRPGVSGGEWQSGRVGGRAAADPLPEAAGRFTTGTAPERAGEVGTYLRRRTSTRPDDPAWVCDGQPNPSSAPRSTSRSPASCRRRLPTGVVQNTDAPACVLRGGPTPSRRSPSFRRGVARRDDRPGLTAPARVIAFSTSSSGTVANVPGVVRHRVRDDEIRAVDESPATVHDVRHGSLAVVRVRLPAAASQAPNQPRWVVAPSKTAHRVLPHRPDPVG